MINCPTCNSSIDLEKIEEMIINFLLTLNEETWCSYNLFAVKFLLFDNTSGKKMHALLDGMVRRNILICESKEIPYHIRRYRLKYRGH